MWRVTATDREGREVARLEIDSGDLTVGRDADRQLILASPSVSRRHCRMRIDASGPVVMDEGSANGVIVNGVRITAPTSVNQLSRIEVAEFRLSVEPLQPAPSALSGSMAAPQGMMPQGMGQGQGQGMSVGAPMGGFGAPMSGQMPGQMPGHMGGPASDLVRLIAEGGPYDGRVFDLPPLQEIAVGRAVDNDLILDDPSLSRKHSKLRRLGGGRLDVEDAHSANGTYVNGRKVDRAQLGPGDTLRFGELMFRIDGGGLVPQARPAGQGPVAQVPQAVKLGFFALGGVTLVVWGLWMWKLASPAPVPQKGQSEDSIARYIRQADAPLRQAQEEFNRRQWARAKEEAEKALNFDPANVDAARLKSQASRAEGDEVKFKRGMSELDKGSQESLGTALSTYYALSLDSSYRNEFAERLTSKLYQGGTDLCKRRVFRECATMLCDSYRVAPAAQKPGGAFIRTMRDAERKGHISAQCVLK